MGITIGVISTKGGVGKTTIASSLASDLANNYGKKVLLVDANYDSPNLGLHMDIVQPDKTIHDVLSGKVRIGSAVYNSFGVDVVSGSYFYDKDIAPLKLKDKLNGLKRNYDFVIIDSSPTFNEDLISSIVASDLLFMVATPDYPTLSCSMKTAQLVRHRGKNVDGVIINKVRSPRHEIGISEIEKVLEIPVIARINDSSANVKALHKRIPVTLFDRKSNFSKEISRLSAALTGNKESPSFVKKLFSQSFRKEVVNRQLFKEGFYTRTFAD
jgi:pilus assembly protein CpaE